MANIPPESVSLAALAANANGSKIINDTAVHQGPWCAFIVLSDAVFTDLSGNLEGWSGFTFPTGLVISGNFSSLQLTSGTLLAYRGYVDA